MPEYASTTAGMLSAAVAAATYAPEGAATLWLPGNSFGPVNGAPTNTNELNRWAVTSFPHTTDNRASWSTVFPSWWATFHLDVFWTSIAGGAGNVEWDIQLWPATIGGVISAGAVNSASLGYAAGAIDVLTVSRLFTGQAVPTVALPVGIEIRRGGGDVADTLIGAAGLIGILLTRAS